MKNATNIKTISPTTSDAALFLTADALVARDTEAAKAAAKQDRADADLINTLIADGVWAVECGPNLTARVIAKMPTGPVEVATVEGFRRLDGTLGAHCTGLAQKFNCSRRAIEMALNDRAAKSAAVRAELTDGKAA